ncbi:TIR domain-containing protein [Umezawaea sp. NPDC059074]|uniref:nSTAND1 domain-containing NTPase n=1 Tax=Umezawaea sp. NPDC059074 TaxID=3346716 RepID=UPI0036A4130D
MANVFVSHAGEDLRVAAEVREWLVADGHRVFLDRDLRDGIAVGEEWEKRLHERLRWADAVVCVVTEAYVRSAWCAAEVGIARSRGSRLLPLHAEAGVEHPLLTSVQHADLAPDPAAARQALAAALGRVDRTGGLGWVDGRSPFPGLRAFEADLHQAFFGRDEDVEALAGLLRSPAERADNALLLVVGPSGCGKSSLVRAGLLPRMADEPGVWTVAAFTPGVDPRATLARELAAAGGRDVAGIRDDLERGRVVEVVDDLLQANRGRRLLVVIDQFEELLTQTPPERLAPFAALLRTALGGPVDVVATLRPEFLDRLLLDPDLGSLPMRTHVLRPLRRETLRTVVEGPARLAGIEVSDELVARLVDDTGSGEALPLLAFTLAELAEGVGVGGELSMARYDALDGVRGALIRQAHAALAEAIAAGGRGRDDVIAGLLRVVTVDEQGHPTRWHVKRADLPAPVVAELDAFVARRLLTIDTVDGEAVVGASHEMFFTAWPPLAEAITKTASALRARRSVEEAAAGWRAADRSAEALWERGRLGAALNATGVRVRGRATVDGLVDLGPDARDFLVASVRHDRSRRRRIVVATSALLVLALVAGLVAFVQRRSAAEQEARAREQALLVTTRQLVAKAEAALDSDPRTAVRLSVAAHRIRPDAETYASVQSALATTPYAGQLTGVTSRVRSIAYSSNGRYLAVGFDSGAIMLWDLADPLRPRRVGEPFIAFDHAVTVAFAAKDSRLVTAGSGGEVVVWDLTDPARPARTGTPVVGQKETVGKSWFSPDGSVLATSREGVPGVQLWDVADPGQVRPLGTPFAADPAKVNAVAFSLDGGTVAVAPRTNELPVTLWDIRDRAVARPLAAVAPNPADIVGSLSFSSDSKTLAVGGDFHGTVLWDLSDLNNLRPGREPIRVGFGSKVTFAPHGGMLATTGDRDMGLFVWDASYLDIPSRAEQLIAGENDLIAVFSPKGNVIASGSESGRVTLWNLARAGRPHALGSPFIGHNGQYPEIYALAMSEDGTLVATGARDTSAVLWDTTDPARPRRIDTLTGHSGEGVDAIGFSPDGRMLATGDGKGAVILWDLTDRDRPRKLGSPLTGPTNIIRSLVFTADGKTLVVGGDQATIFWDVRQPTNPAKIARVLDRELVLGIWRVRDGRVLGLVLGSGTYASTTSIAPPTVVTTTESGGHAEAGSAKAQEGGPGDRTGTRLWDITDPAHPRQVGSGLVGHEQDVGTAALSPAGDLLATGDAKGAVVLWDVKDPEHARRLGDPLHPHGSTSSVSVAFAPTTDLMVTGGIDQNAYLWDLGSRILPRKFGTSLADNLDTVSHLVFSANGELLATAGSQGDVVLWDMRPTYDLRGHLDETACEVTGGGLDRDQWTRYLPDLEYRDTCAGR